MAISRDLGRLKALSFAITVLIRLEKVLLHDLPGWCSFKRPGRHLVVGGRVSCLLHVRRHLSLGGGVPQWHVI